MGQRFDVTDSRNLLAASGSGGAPSCSDTQTRLARRSALRLRNNSNGISGTGKIITPEICSIDTVRGGLLESMFIANHLRDGVIQSLSSFEAEKPSAALDQSLLGSSMATHIGRVR